MELKPYFAPLIKWWRLLLAATLLAAAASFVATIGQPPIFQSRTTLMIGQSLSNPNPSSSQFFLEQQLAAIYADMGTREPVRKGVMEALGLTWLPTYTVRALPETQLVEITVNDTDPVRAQAVASEIANQLMSRTPTNMQTGEQDRQEFIDQQLNLLQSDIKNTQSEVERLKIELGSLTSAFQIAETERQITAMENKLSSLQDNYASLLASTQKGALNTLNVIEPADIPSRPIGPNKLLTIMIAALVGLSFAAGGAYLIEWLDQTIKTSEEAGRIIQAPLLAEIPRIPEDANAISYVNDQPFSVITDSFRSLRTNLEFLGLAQSIKTILIASPGDSEGKTTLSINLALALAKSKKRVIVIDADFYKSVINEKLGLPKQKGLGDLLVDGKVGKEHLIPLFKGQIYLLPVGTTPANPSEQLSSFEMTRILTILKEVADVIIVDGPPFIVSDSLALAAKTDSVLLVLNPNRSRRDILNSALAQLKRANANVLGYVMNGTAPKSAYYYSYYSNNTPRKSNGSAAKSSTPVKENDSLKKSDEVNLQRSSTS